MNNWRSQNRTMSYHRKSGHFTIGRRGIVGTVSHGGEIKFCLKDRVGFQSVVEKMCFDTCAAFEMGKLPCVAKVIVGRIGCGNDGIGGLGVPGISNLNVVSVKLRLWSVYALFCRHLCQKSWELRILKCSMNDGMIGRRMQATASNQMTIVGN